MVEVRHRRTVFSGADLGAHEFPPDMMHTTHVWELVRRRQRAYPGVGFPAPLSHRDRVMLGSLLAATCISLVAAGENAAGQPAPTVDYARDVRPILAKNCFACHGPDDQKRQAELRLDERDGATRELPSGKRAIVAGNPAQSELLARVTSGDEATVMPPAECEKRPSPREIAVLRAWVEQGAAYSKHWSYVKPVRPALPAVRDRSWPRGAIDTFILARLEAERLAHRRQPIVTPWRGACRST